jgi:pyruvate/2-oxoglutarate dehydrogenase complex dihydrolipoamide acyltransferase (E2) component
MTLMTCAAFAKHLCQQRSYVKLLKDMGRLVMEGDKVNVEASMALIEATKDPSKQGVVDRHQAQREAKLADAQITVPFIAENIDYQSAKARREQANAEIAEMERDLMREKLVKLDDVKHAIAYGDAIVRNRLEALPDILAPQLCAEPNEQRVRVLLLDAIETVLSELSKTFTKLDPV